MHGDARGLPRPAQATPRRGEVWRGLHNSTLTPAMAVARGMG